MAGRMASTAAVPRLCRFTTLPALLDLLTRKKLVLLDPVFWEDKNDSGFLQEYARRKGVRVHALCFTLENETIHHWNAFADGRWGCCIEFDPIALMKVFDEYGLKHGPVKYRKLREARKGDIATDDIPFTKRRPYACEKEYRVIREGKEDRLTFEVAVDPGIIRKITVSQRMPDTVYETIKQLLRKASGNPKHRVSRSTLYENPVWLNNLKSSPSP